MNETDQLVLSGPPALSRLRLEKLKQQVPGVVFSEYVHVLNCADALSPKDRGLCEELLNYDK